MIAVLTATLPLFAMIAIGYAVVATQLLPPGAMRVLGAYVLTLALPALLFDTVTSRSASEVFDLGFIAAYSLGSVAMVALAQGWFRLQVGTPRRHVAVMGSSFPNSSFIGFPLMLLVMPNIAGQVLSMSLLVEAALITPLTYLPLAFASGKRSAPVPPRPLSAAWGVLRRPVVLALLVGLALSLSNISPPGPVSQVTGMLAASAPAIALLSIGGFIAERPKAGNWGLAAQIVIAKLLVHPSLTFAVVLALAFVGLPLETEMRRAVLLTAALPMLSIYSVLAQEAGEEVLASIALLGATVSAFATLSTLLWLLT